MEDRPALPEADAPAVMLRVTVMGYWTPVAVVTVKVIVTGPLGVSVGTVPEIVSVVPLKIAQLETIDGLNTGLVPLETITSLLA